MLDTPAEKEFDDIVELATQICDTPISVITLLTEGRQWFKAKKGIDVNETGLDVSICAHAILQHDVFEVQDTTTDARFRDNPLVTMANGLRFYTGAILKTPEGLPLGMLCVLDTRPRQLTDHQKFALSTLATQVMKQLELKKTIREYAEKNAELTHFSHAIAHDLRDPLASVTMLAQMLKMKYAPQMEPRAGEMVDTILSSTERSLNLLTNMLALAEADDRQLTDESCDGNAVLAATLENLAAAIAASGTSVEAEPLPYIDMGAGELGQILQNLIGNAMNYRDRNRDCRITISATPVQAGRATITVRDNGIGITHANLNAIFAPLKRLHGSERPGTGLGLSITRKIVERRDGRIWVESVFGQGTSFCFTVPATERRLKITA
ncbi:MAG: ATP-binding protein [bacterium]|nr:ATP-binding protein [bacterium]